MAGFGLATLVFALSTTLWLSLAALGALGAFDMVSFDMVSMVSRGALVQLGACRTLVVEARVRLCEDRFSTLPRPMVAPWAKKRQE